MFSSLFLSKNQKLVQKWTNEHEQIVGLATDVITSYKDGKVDIAKDALVDLRLVTLNHLMAEDMEFVELLKDHENTDNETEQSINEFTETFYNTKTTLKQFLKEYTRPDAVLDDAFLESFKGLVDVLAKRIDFEEKNLYNKLDQK